MQKITLTKMLTVPKRFLAEVLAKLMSYKTETEKTVTVYSLKK